ncbi:MAG: hypothetical protein ACP5GC_10195 [Thiomonas sp.]|jgi:hypothetical protein
MSHQPQPLPEERQLVAALTEVLRQQRQALVNSGSEGAAPVAPIWQPLLDALDGYTALRQSGNQQSERTPELVAAVTALREETLALQHTLSIWSAALQQAIDQSNKQTPEPVYRRAGAGTAAYAGAPGQSLGRG